MLVEDYEIEARYDELKRTNPTFISAEYKLMLMILCVLGDIRKLLQPVNIESEVEIKIPEEELIHGNRNDESKP